MGRISRRSSLRSSSKTIDKENGGDVSGIHTQSGKVKKSKIRPMPDFSKLHKKWEQKFSSNKAQTKKPVTSVQEFVLSKKSEKTTAPTNKTNSKSPLNTRVVQEILPSSRRGLATAGNDMPRESFGTMAQQQQMEGLNFEADKSALQSILDETGVEGCNTDTFGSHGVVEKKMEPLSGSTRGYTSSIGVVRKESAISGAIRASARVTESGFKIPPLPRRLTSSACPRRFSSLRESLLHRGCEACHSNKNGALSSGKSVNTPPKLPSKAAEKRNAPDTPMSECKAERVLVKTPTRRGKSPGERLTMTESRAQRVLVKPPFRSPGRPVLETNSTGKKYAGSATWRDVLEKENSAKKDKLSVKLEFLDEAKETQEDCPSSKDGAQLRKLEDLERKLEAEIASTENKQRRHPSGTPRECIEMSVHGNARPRPVLGELPAEEINRRSKPEFREEKKDGSSYTDKNKDVPFKVHATPPRQGTKKVHFESPSVTSARNQSPSARYRMNKASPRNRMTETANSPKAPRTSVLKSHQGRYSPLGSRASKSLSKQNKGVYNLGNQALEQQVCSIMAEIDKENCSPPPMLNMGKMNVGNMRNTDGKVAEKMVTGREVSKKPVKFASVRQSTVKVLKETDEEYLLLEESFDLMSLHEVSTTLNESMAAMETLNAEAESLLEQSITGADDSTTDIARQLKMIQQKQEELMRMQRALQKRLTESKAAKRQRRREQQQREIEGRSKTARESGTTNMLSMSQESGKCDNVVAVPGKCGNVVDVSPISQSGYHQTTSVVDMSPIGQSDELISDQSRAVFAMRTPEKGSSPSLLYKANKRSPLFPPLESTASESVYNGREKETRGPNHEYTNGHVKQKEEGGWLAAGLLQMAEQLNATPHKSTHWKKQMLKEEPQSTDLDLLSPLNAVGGESFMKTSESCNTLTPIGRPLSVPHIGGGGVQTTPSAHTPILSLIGSGKVTSPGVFGSPQRFLSGSAQVIPMDTWSQNSSPPAKPDPILTPLAMREKALRDNNVFNTSFKAPENSVDKQQRTPSLADLDISIDASKSPEDLSMAFSESPGTKPGFQTPKNGFAMKSDTVSGFRSPRNFQSPGSAFASPVSRRTSDLYMNMGGGVPFISPVQFTINRRNTPSIVRPMPRSKVAASNRATDVEMHHQGGSHSPQLPASYNTNTYNTNSYIYSKTLSMFNGQQQYSSHGINVMAPSHQSSLHGDCGSPLRQENGHSKSARMIMMSGSCNTISSVATTKQVEGISTPSPRCSVKKPSPRARAFSPKIILDSKTSPSIKSGRLTNSPGRRLKASRSPRNLEIGELSLRGNVRSGARVGQWSELQARAHLNSCRDLLADREVEFYTSTLQNLSLELERCMDPVSDVLLNGDEYHFVPIPVAEAAMEMKKLKNITPLKQKRIGSAFSPIRL